MLHVLLTSINMSKMRRIVHRDPFHLVNILKKGPHSHILGLILRAIEKQSRNVYLVQLRHNRPIPQRPGN